MCLSSLFVFVFRIFYCISLKYHVYGLAGIFRPSIFPFSFPLPLHPIPLYMLVVERDVPEAGGNKTRKNAKNGDCEYGWNKMRNKHNRNTHCYCITLHLEFNQCVRGCFSSLSSLSLSHSLAGFLFASNRTTSIQLSWNVIMSTEHITTPPNQKKT